MDMSNKNGVVEPPKVVIEESDETKALLSPSNNGGLANKSDKPKRKVQWMDKNGDKLAEILEYQPSDVSDSEEDDSDSCNCRIM
ncbi:uncharacterized protein LOC125194198 [Salvia hispanica]|uniref:uncharacterized protein LOC125194198 n=1 Tax=Salvia hispanica TaxID=49212 RepID=UPI002009B848|nr:uncharacterized protein LOC125194198 [Salvia hispanica]XP_047948238.1 uncharacterized protein LOC125194198 [Salvia hispanica]